MLISVIVANFTDYDYRCKCTLSIKYRIVEDEYNIKDCRKCRTVVNACGVFLFFRTDITLVCVLVFMILRGFCENYTNC